MAHIHKQSVLLIGHRRTLLKELSTRLHLKCYLDEWDRGYQLPGESDGKAQDRLSDSRPDFYGISVDSLPLRLPHPRPYDIVIIDECEQVLSHVSAQTLKHRPTVLKILRHYLTTSPTLYLFDADLNNVTTSFVFRCRSDRVKQGMVADLNTKYIVNQFRENNREYELFESDKDLQNSLLESAYNGLRLFVACNSKRHAEALDVWLRKKVPSCRILLVTAEEKDSQPVREFLANVVEEFLKYDVVIASPAIGTGIDITFPDGACKIDVVYGFFSDGINSHYDVDQQLGRVRNPGAVKVWVSKKEDYFETDVRAIKMEMVLTGKYDAAINGYSTEGNPLFDIDDPLLSLQAEAYAAYRASQNRLLYYFTQHKARNGWTAKSVAASKGNDQVSKEMGAIAADLMFRRVERILSAERIGADRYGEYVEQRKMGKPIGMAATFEGARFELEKFYCREADEELVELDDDGRFRDRVERFESLAIHRGQEQLERQMCDYWATSNWKKAFPAVGHPLLDALYLSSGLVHGGKFSAKSIITTETMEPFTVLARERAKLLEMDYSIRLRRDFDRKPIQTLNEILDLIGLKVEVRSFKKIEGKKRYYYSLSDPLLETMTGIVEMRRAAGIAYANRDIEHFRLKLSGKRPQKPATYDPVFELFDRG